MTVSRVRHAPRFGFALPAAMIALAVLSALVAGVLFVATEELRAGRTDMASQRALAAADWALERAILSWDLQRNTSETAGVRTVTGDSAVMPNDKVVVTATRVDRRAVWMTAAVTSGGDGGPMPVRHTVGASLRLVGATVPVRAALTAMGGVAVGGGIIDGRDAAATDDPSGICREDAVAETAGIIVPAPSRVTCADCGTSAESGVFGNPPIDSATGTDSLFVRFGDETVAGLAARASIIVGGATITARPSVTDDGKCNRSDLFNWGSPDRMGPCADYYPIIHVRGNAVLAGGSQGQGILLIDGSLRVDAGSRFVGVVVASDDIVVSGAGAEIVGAAFAADGDRVGGSSVVDGGVIRVGACAVRRATLGSSRLRRTAGRWWVELR